MPMKSFLFAAFLLIGVGLLNQSAFRVMETEKAILLEFGNLIDADIKPGLHFKLPIAQEVKKFDARVLTLDSQGETYYTLEKKPLIVDSFVKWRVADIERFYTGTSFDERRAQRLLQERVKRLEIGIAKQTAGQRIACFTHVVEKSLCVYMCLYRGCVQTGGRRSVNRVASRRPFQCGCDSGMVEEGVGPRENAQRLPGHHQGFKLLAKKLGVEEQIPGLWVASCGNV